MTCRWLFLASRTTEESLCGKPGYPYCEEHQPEMAYFEKSDWEYQDIGRSWESITSHSPASDDSSWRAEQRSNVITLRKRIP
jgi:hypothetical protein